MYPQHVAGRKYPATRWSQRSLSDKYNKMHYSPYKRLRFNPDGKTLLQSVSEEVVDLVVMVVATTVISLAIVYITPQILPPMDISPEYTDALFRLLAPEWVE
jgi:hypothetical protein